MTPYTHDELAQGWEFKIVRANRAVFRKREVLERLLAEEGRAGWSMVEKFDDSRIRFKRPQSARLNDGALPPDVDPYRVIYGLPQAAFVLVLVSTIIAVVAAVMALIVVFVVPR